MKLLIFQRIFFGCTKKGVALMSAESPESRRLKEDADAIKEKYGPFPDVYAETRSEASETVGDDANKKHWEKIAVTVNGDSE